MSGMRPLSPAQRRYVLAAAQGLTAQQTASLFHVSLHAVNGGLRDAKAVLGAVTIAHAVALAMANGEFGARDVRKGSD